MATTNNNSDLIPKDDLAALGELNTKLTESKKQFTELLSEAEKVSSTFSKIKTDYKELIAAIHQYNLVNAKVNTTSKEQRILQDQIEKQQARINQQKSAEARELEKLRQEYNNNQRALRNQIKEQENVSTSIESMRGKLNRMIQLWDKMSDTMRKSNIGQSMQQEIAKVTEAVSKGETATNRFQRNVGNYPMLSGMFGKDGVLGSLFSGNFSQAGQAMSGMLSVFGGNMITKAVSGVSSLVGEIKDFTVESIKMASQAEGVQRAFDKLNQPNLLTNLREATKNTVNDLVLMQSAVKANSFQIPVENLGNYLKFAQQRAQETGQSVDYLVDSIINGIGRKSPLILDNLGISAARLRKEMADGASITVATTKIVNEELEKQGVLTLTSADKAQQASTKWDNAMLAIGNKTKWLGDIWNKMSGEVADSISSLSGDMRSMNQRYDDQINKVADLKVNIDPLLTRYDQLSKTTKLNYADTGDLTKEQTELRDITQKIALAIPDAVTALDSYGRAMSVNTSTARTYISTQKELLKYFHADAIEEFVKKRGEAADELRKINQKFEDGYELRWDEFGEHKDVIEVNSTLYNRLRIERNKWLNQYEKSVNAIRELDGTNAGELSKAREDEIAQTNRFNAMEKDQLDIWIKNKQNANDKYMYIAKQVYDQQYAGDDEDAAKKAADAAKRASEQAKKLSDQELKALQDLAQLEIDTEVAKNKKLLSDNLKSYKERIAAVNDYEEKAGESIINARDNQIAATESQLKKGEINEVTAKAIITALYRKSESELDKISEEGGKFREDITKNHLDKQIKAYNDGLSEVNIILDKDEQEALLKSAESYKRGEIDQKRYEEERLNITKQSAKNRFEAEIAFLKATLQASTDAQKDLYGQQMQSEFKGNVDLLNRPLIDAAELTKKGWEDAGEGIATVFSSQYGVLSNGKEVEILVTPILPDGTVLSQDELESYIDNILDNTDDILAADDKGIVISVNVDKDGQAGERLHELQEQYYSLGESSQASADIQKKIQDAELKYNKSINNQKIKDEEDAAKKILDIQKDAAKRRKDLLQEIYEESVELLSTLGEAETERKLQRLEKESEENQAWRDEEIAHIEQLNEAGAISDEQADARKAVVENQAKAREDAINQKKKQVQIEQAKREKAIALAQIAISTAQAIMKNNADLGFILAAPINVLTMALGAIQAATVLAQPLPAYKDGTDDHKGGHAIVGDGGRSELILTPDGRAFKTPDRATLVDLPKHTVVMPDYAKAISSGVIRHNDNKPNIVVMENKKQLALTEKTNRIIKDIARKQSRPIIVKTHINQHNLF